MALGAGGHLAGGGFNPAQVAGLAGTDTAGFGGGVHRAAGEVQVAAEALRRAPPIQRSIVDATSVRAKVHRAFLNTSKHLPISHD